MAEPNDGNISSDSRQRVKRKRASRSPEGAPAESGTTSGIPCGACKFLRRKCVNGCIFTPHFTTEQGAALFAAVHKVFGASNVSKLLMHLPLQHRHHAVETISYEAQARLSDPVYGCVSTIIALQQQVLALQMELAMVQNQLINKRLTVANTFQSTSQQPETVSHLEIQPMYLNDSSASNNNIIKMDSYDSSLQNFASDHQCLVHSQPSIDPLQLSQFCQRDQEENEDPLAFVDQMLQAI
uniref:LOB domain-containing protein 20-like n=1 Tax=Erigeron canadensis TaxID=72917 RepID=UPI001CB9A699|nr:LOB domain-containing protein 20-like [Erigeron canadensis]